MAEPSYWQTVPAGQVWDPLANSDPQTGDWVDTIDISQPGGGEMYARDDASVILTGHIPYAKRYDARKKILGAAYADGGTPWGMHRINPLPHPTERHLRAAQLDMRGFNPMGIKVSTDPAPVVLSVYVPAPGVAGQPAGTILLPRVANYTRAETTIKFRPHPYQFVDDAVMVSSGFPEYYRNCSFIDSIEPVLDVLLATGEPFLEWADGPNAGVADSAKRLISSQVPEFIQKGNLVIAWFHVPAEYLIAATSSIPAKIMDGVGHVNLNDWNGFAAGTLKLEAPRFRRAVQAAVRTDPTLYSNIPFVYDVMLPFSYVNPDPAAGGATVFKGWNLYVDGPRGKFYSVKRTASPPGTPLPYIPFYDFDKLFQHAGAP